MAEKEKKDVKEFTKKSCWGCASIFFLILAFCVGGPLGGFFTLAIFCIILGILKHKNERRARKKLIAEIELRTSELVNLRKLFEETDVENADLKKMIGDANEEIEKLLKIKERYQGVIDIEEEIKRLKAEANSEIEKQRNDAKWEIDREKADATRNLSLLEEKINKLNKEKGESEELLTAIKNSIEG